MSDRFIHLLENAAMASQHRPLIDDEVVVVAIKRNIWDVLEREKAEEISRMKQQYRSKIARLEKELSDMNWKKDADQWGR